MNQAITHENFNAAIDRCKNGLSNLMVATSYRVTLIKGKHLKQWEKEGLNLLEMDTKSKGFYIRRGKQKDYIFPPSMQAILFEIPA